MTDQKRPNTVEYFDCLGSITCTSEIQSRIATAKAAFNTKALFTSKLDSDLRKKLEKWYIWSIALYGAKTWALRKVYQKYLEYFERMEKIRYTDRVRNEVRSQRREEYPTYNNKKKG